MTENEIIVEQETVFVSGSDSYEAGENIYFTESQETGNQVINAVDTIYDDTQITQDISNLSSNKADKSSTYTKSEVDSLIPDVSNFITKSVDDLVNYYKKNETYTQSEVNALISAISTINILVVQELPTQDISTTTIYLVPKSTSETNNIYDEYIYVSNNWEKIGDTQIDLSNYVTTSMLNTALANYTTTNDLTTLLNTKQNVINSSNKLNADLVDDSNSTNKFFSGNYNDLSNKPTIPSALSDLSEDTTHRVVTDTEKTTWSGKQDVMQYSTMPIADSTTVGKIIQYTGTTTNDYTNGYFYIGVDNSGTYSWENVLVQAGGSSLPKMVVINRNNYNTPAIISAVDAEYQKYLNNEEPCIYCYNEQNATTQAFGTQKLRVWSASTTTFNLKSDFIITDKVDNFSVVDNTQLVKKTTGKLYVDCTVTSGHITAISIPSYEDISMITANGSTYALMTWSSTGARFLAKNNTNSYTPTDNYNPSTKLYTDKTHYENMSGYDATKTQVLKNINGTLTWVDE